MKLCEFGRKTPEFCPSHWWTWNNWNIEKTTGLLIWSKTIGTQTHAHAYIHRNTKLLENVTKITYFGHSGDSSCMYWYSNSWNDIRKAPELTSSETRPLPSGSYLKRLQEFTIEGDPWTWLKLHETTGINTRKWMQYTKSAKNAKRDRIRLFLQVMCMKSWTFSQENTARMFHWL